MNDSGFFDFLGRLLALGFAVFMLALLLVCLKAVTGG
jgi:hypothetical protein